MKNVTARITFGNEQFETQARIDDILCDILGISPRTLFTFSFITYERKYAIWYNTSHPNRKISWLRLNRLQERDAKTIKLPVVWVGRMSRRQRQAELKRRGILKRVVHREQFVERDRRGGVVSVMERGATSTN